MGGVTRQRNKGFSNFKRSWKLLVRPPFQVEKWRHGAPVTWEVTGSACPRCTLLGEAERGGGQFGDRAVPRAAVLGPVCSLSDYYGRVELSQISLLNDRFGKRDYFLAPRWWENILIIRDGR